MRRDTDGVAAFLGGFVAAEGTFAVVGDPPTFRFAIGLGATDRDSCFLAMTFLGVGSVRTSPRRRTHHDDVVCFQARRLRDLVEVVVPFMDEHLPPSHKRRQYLAWRERLLDHWEHRARRRRPCTVDGCDAPRRAHGLCRHHLYRHRGV